MRAHDRTDTRESEIDNTTFWAVLFVSLALLAVATWFFYETLQH